MHSFKEQYQRRYGRVKFYFHRNCLLFPLVHRSLSLHANSENGFHWGGLGLAFKLWCFLWRTRCWFACFSLPSNWFCSVGMIADVGLIFFLLTTPCNIKHHTGTKHHTVLQGKIWKWLPINGTVNRPSWVMCGWGQWTENYKSRHCWC